jgi:hypothetical protein
MRHGCLAGRTSRQQLVEVGSPDPHSSPHVERRPLAFVYPVPDRLLVDFQDLRDLVHGHELVWHQPLA